MPALRSIALISALALIGILAACSPTAGQSPSASPSATAAPSESPASPEPESPTPAPSPTVVAEHETPMQGRTITDGLIVRELPGADASPLAGQSMIDGSRLDEVTLAAGELVNVFMGPVVVGGDAYYQVSSADGSTLNFHRGYLPGDALERAGELPIEGPQFLTIYGFGTSESVSADAMVGTKVSIDFVAAPTDDAEACEIEVTLHRTDGTAVNVATESLTEPMTAELGPEQLSSLFQEQPGTVTLEVETSDCSFAASMVVA